MSTTPLPERLRGWLEAALGAALPAEGRATCDRCVMCVHAGVGPAPPDPVFDARVKCCTYQPLIPSFTVGAILADETPEAAEGRAAIAERVRRRVGATPLGLFPGPAYADAYHQLKEKGGFGTRVELRCPHYSESRGGSCSIWRHREAVCATWFCKHEGGALGGAVWTQVKDLLKQAQNAVVHECLERLGLRAIAEAELFTPAQVPIPLGSRALRGPVSEAGVISEPLARRLWGPWFGREEEYFRECDRIAGELTWPEIRGLAGQRLAVVEARVKAAEQARRENALPPVLYLGSADGATLPDGQVSARSTELMHDGLRVPADLWAAMDAFDGRPNAEVLVTLSGRLGRPVGEDEVARLRFHGILVPPDGRDREPGRGPARPIAKDTMLRFFRWYQDCAVFVSVNPGPRGDTITVHCGPKRVTFEDPAAHLFAQNLVKFQNGFRAGDAVKWVPGDHELPWPRVRQMLEALRGQRVLQDG
jgi:hypothetical protein